MKLKNSAVKLIVGAFVATALVACAPPHEKDADVPKADTATVGATNPRLNEDADAEASETHDVAPSESGVQASIESESAIGAADAQTSDQGVDQPVDPVDQATLMTTQNNS